LLGGRQGKITNVLSLIAAFFVAVAGWSQVPSGIVPDADIMIHTEPLAPNEHSLFEKFKCVARRSNLAVHGLLAHEVDCPHVATPRSPKAVIHGEGVAIGSPRGRFPYLPFSFGLIGPGAGRSTFSTTF
jgi:hypothetical protein